MAMLIKEKEDPFKVQLNPLPHISFKKLVDFEMNIKHKDIGYGLQKRLSCTNK